MDKSRLRKNVKCGWQKQECTFTPEQTLKLIDAVKEYPILWQRSHVDYKNLAIQEGAWHQIEMKFGLPSETLKCKWQNCRAQFRRFRAKVYRSERTGSHVKCFPAWYGYSPMSFLLDSAEEGQTRATPRRKRHPSPAESIEESSTKITISPVQEPKSSLRQPIAPVVQHTSASLSRLSRQAQANSSAHFKTEMLSVMQLFKEEYAEIRKRSRNSGFFDYANEELEKRDPALHDDIKKAIIDLIKTYPDNE